MDFLDTKDMLQRHYNLPTNQLPEPRQKNDWKPENNFGFLLGLLEFGLDNHRTQLHNLLAENRFAEKEKEFIDSMFDFYIRPFHMSYIKDSERCYTPINDSPSRSNSVEELENVPEEKEFKHTDLKNALLSRDGVCLFCWNSLECEAAHIIAQKNSPIAYDESSLFFRAGLTQKHQIQNGLLLCVICHRRFDKLKQYVDVVEEKMVIKIVNEANDETSAKHRVWEWNVSDLVTIRSGRENRFSNIDSRLAVKGEKGEMALYFIENDQTKWPNRNALAFHKAACLIWRMAGGAEIDEEYCSDDEELGPVDTAALKRRFNIQDSSETLNQFVLPE
jgi:hypothetical protein